MKDTSKWVMLAIIAMLSVSNLVMANKFATMEEQRDMQVEVQVESQKPDTVSGIANTLVLLADKDKVDLEDMVSGMSSRDAALVALGYNEGHDCGYDDGYNDGYGSGFDEGAWWTITHTHLVTEDKSLWDNGVDLVAVDPDGYVEREFDGVPIEGVKEVYGVYD